MAGEKAKKLPYGGGPFIRGLFFCGGQGPWQGRKPKSYGTGGGGSLYKGPFFAVAQAFVLFLIFRYESLMGL